MSEAWCRNCRQPVRRIQPCEGYDLRDYQWEHVDGGLLCGMEPPRAEPDLPGVPCRWCERYIAAGSDGRWHLVSGEDPAVLPVPCNGISNEHKPGPGR